jgi:hypothetical protein
MPEQIALIEAPIYETTGERSCPVMHEITAFELMGSRVSVRVDPADEVIEIAFGQRRFQLSILDLAATAAITVEGHLKGEIVRKVIASRATPEPPIEKDCFITVVPDTRRVVPLSDHQNRPRRP